MLSNVSPLPPSHRRERRSDTVTYRVRIELDRTKPPLWRRLDVASDLFLDDVHDVIQVAFGWTDSHLHRFACGPAYYSRESEFYLCPFEVDEGEVGIPEGDVRLDEVLAETGERLFYMYDFGDDWLHVLTLEAVLPGGEPSPRAICLDGQRAGPVEDCGGVHAYELIAAATDRAHPDHLDAIGELADIYGAVDPHAFETTPFDLDAITGGLAELGLEGVRAVAELPEPLEDLVREVRFTPDRRSLRQLLGAAALDRPVLIDAVTATRMVRPYSWLLDRVGAEGIKLTGAGYLPPVHVAAAWVELDLSREWIGKGNREEHTWPVLHLRESAQALGLVRKHRGRLVLTPRGRAVRGDPVALWWHLAERLPLKSRDLWDEQAGLLLLVAVAARAGLTATVERHVDALRWRTSDGQRLANGMATHAALDTMDVLRRLGTFSEDRPVFGDLAPVPNGVTLARAALCTWPGGRIDPS